MRASISTWNGHLVYDDGLKREQVAPQFRTLSDNDLNCKAAFIAARKPVR